MRRSIATVSLSGTLRQKLEAIAAAGFDGIELFENDFINFNGTAAELRRITEDLGLSIERYQPFLLRSCNVLTLTTPMARPTRRHGWPPRRRGSLSL